MMSAAQGNAPLILANEPIRLGVIKDGENWVVTTRARIQSGKQKWQAFNVIFTTRKEDKVKFHPHPETEPQLPPGIPPGDWTTTTEKVDAQKK